MIFFFIGLFYPGLMCRIWHFNQFFNFQIALTSVHSPMMVSALNLPNVVADVIFHCRTIASTMELIKYKMPLWLLSKSVKSFHISEKALAEKFILIHFCIFVWNVSVYFIDIMGPEKTNLFLAVVKSNN